LELDNQLSQPLGVEVIGDTIFVAHNFEFQKDDFLKKVEIRKYFDNDGSGMYRGRAKLPPIPDEYKGRWSLGLIHHNGYLYANVGAPKSTAYRYDFSKGTYETVAEFMRYDNGLGIGPDNEMFTISQQGEYYPTSELQHIKKGRKFAYKGNRNYPSAVKFPQAEAANSPSQPLLFNKGVFKNQMVMGDMRHSNMHRVYLELVDGKYQGGISNFSGGNKVGINRIAWSPDGALYLGSAGATNHWTHNYNENYYGLHRLKPNSYKTFEMLKVSSKATGFIVEFTEEVSASMANPELFMVRSWNYKTSATYGVPKLNMDTLNISSAILSGDRKKIFLDIEGLKAGKIIHISHKPQLISASGKAPWILETWYTLNNFGEEFNQTVFQTVLSSFITFNKSGPIFSNEGMNYSLSFSNSGKHVVEIFNIMGKSIFRHSGIGKQTLRLPVLSRGIYFLKARSGSTLFQTKFIAGGRGSL